MLNIPEPNAKHSAEQSNNASKEQQPSSTVGRQARQNVGPPHSPGKWRVHGLRTSILVELNKASLLLCKGSRVSEKGRLVNPHHWRSLVSLLTIIHILSARSPSFICFRRRVTVEGAPTKSSQQLTTQGKESNIRLVPKNADKRTLQHASTSSTNGLARTFTPPPQKKRNRRRIDKPTNAEKRKEGDTPKDPP